VLIDKVLRSAIANADEQEANVSRLYVMDAHVDAGPAFRRWRQKDRGRAHPINKGTSHIVVTVEEIGRGALETASSSEASRG
jgi:large subunit ribosomal protein L22